MGLFDCVTGVVVKCPKCEREVSEFQTEDGNPYYTHMVDFRTVTNFYGRCTCGHTIEYRRKQATSLDDFETVESDVQD